METFIYKEGYSYPIALMLNVTDNCNLACRYCFVEQHPHNMTLDTAKKALHYIYNNFDYINNHQDIKQEIYGESTLENSKVNFFGGEPLLCYENIIKPLILYAEKEFNNFFNFGITTNITLLDKEKIDFFKQHNLSGILASIDGAEETQCYNRPCRNGDNSFKLIEKNIPYLLENFPATCFRSTVYAPTVKYLFENYKYAESQGFKQYAMIPNERDNWTEEQKQILYDEIKKICFYRLQQRINGTQIMRCNMLEYSDENFPNLLGITNPQRKDSIFRCGLGTVSCAIGWDGKIYGCQQDVSPNDKNIFYIGDLQNGINPERHSKLLKKYIEEINTEQPNKCLNCLLNNTCYSTSSGWCPSTNISLFNTTHQISDIRCFFHEITFKTSLLEAKILTDLYHNKNNIFAIKEDNNENEKQGQVN